MRSDDIRTYVWNSETQAYEVGKELDKKSGELKTINNSNWYASDFFVENASFLRIDNITLGYSFNKPKVQGRAYVTVSNPCVFSKYKGLDPEVGGGIDNNIYPRSMTTVMGISLQF
jgi:iron complex outermembrane receptor protein